jgi:hypothetical protein
LKNFIKNAQLLREKKILLRAKKKFQSFELYKVWSNKTEKAQSFDDFKNTEKEGKDGRGERKQFIIFLWVRIIEK